MHHIQEIVRLQKRGVCSGIFSCCSANEYVLKAAMQRVKKYNSYLLIESTANQVNQYGGYTGLTPSDFYRYVNDLAEKEKFPLVKLILGGDHLGPLTWTNMDEEHAMREAAELVRQYVDAGFTKIHIDTSMRLADDDPSVRLDEALIASRGAFLCQVAEDAYLARKAEDPETVAPIYIIGSEVPIPGGAQEAEDSISVTSAEDCEKTIQMFYEKFKERKLLDAWDRVLGLVVQPGVEYGDSEVFGYNREMAQRLSAFIKNNNKFVFEGHSTDYQTKENLKSMVEDGIAILKVGPALTYYLREALFALENIENEMLRDKNMTLSNFRKTLDSAMLENPGYWVKHYHGDEADLRLSRAFSLSDRCRYYLSESKVQESMRRLVENLNSIEIPETLISQYMPVQHESVRRGELPNRPEDLVLDHIGECIDDYLFATIKTR
jgi:D-tagatose-1,6-bisphosphate aldolase subunit GatZ/KbaZ